MSNFIGCLVLVLLSPLLLTALLIYLVIYLPIDFIRHRKDPYFTELGIRYSAFTSGTDQCRAYNAIRERGLPIKYIHQTEEEKSDFMVFGDTVILFGLYFSIWYNEEAGRFESPPYEPDDEETDDGSIEEGAVFSLDEIIGMSLECCVPHEAYTEGMKTAILADEELVAEKDLDRAKALPELILYNRAKDIPDLLEQYVRDHSTAEGSSQS